LFMTATPRYFTGRVLKAAQEADLEVASMDDEAKFGKVFHRLTFGEAIKRQLLTDYQVVVVGVDNYTYLQWAQRGTLITRDGEKVTDARTLAGQIGLAKAMREYNLQRIISFHSRVARAREFANEMPEVIAWMPTRQRPKGALWSRHASGEMSAGKRHVLLQHLSRLDDGERGLLTNARCLSEGIDVPTLDGVAFVDPRRSEVDIVQAVGRAIRKSEGKIVGTIVIPVFIEADANPETALDDSSFKPVWDVIQALRAHDEVLGEQIDSLRREMGRTCGVPKLPDKIHLDLPVTVDAAFADAFDVRLVERTTQSWEFWFGLLERYVADYGNSRVPQDFKSDDEFQLGAWVNSQRIRHKGGKLERDRFERLRRLDGWVWNASEAKWDEGFHHLEEFAKERGHVQVPIGHEVEGFKLRTWYRNQRAKFDKLSAERQHRLGSLPGWHDYSHDVRWEKAFQLLLNYVEEHGNAKVDRSCVIDGYPLGTWAMTQRLEFKRGRLDKDRTKRLAALTGWDWDRRGNKWEDGYSRLVEYLKQNGSQPRQNYVADDGYRLGAWISQQRTNYDNGLLPLDRQKRLGKLPGWHWEPQAAKWEEGFQRLQAYVKQYGHARVPATYEVNGYRLGAWVAQQRNKRANGSLQPQRFSRLDAVKRWDWNPPRGAAARTAR
jgi:hypothetical protein